MAHFDLAYTNGHRSGHWYGIAPDAKEAERRLRRFLNRKHPRLTFVITLASMTPVEQ